MQEASMTDNFSPSSQVSPELKDQELEFLNSIFDLARNNKPIALQSLLDQGIPVNLTNSHGDTLLILAAYHEHEEIVRVLLKAGADLDRLNDRGQTALVCAVFRDNLTISQLLLDAGANASLGTQTPADVARFFDLPRMQELLATAVSTAE